MSYETNISDVQFRDELNDLEQIFDYVVENFDSEIGLVQLEETLGKSRFKICRLFKKEFGITPMKWVWNLRTLVAEKFIKNDSRFSLTDIAFSCGFSSSAHFSRQFKAVVGCTPSEVRKDIELEGTTVARKGVREISDTLKVYAEECIEKFKMLETEKNETS